MLFIKQQIATTFCLLVLMFAEAGCGYQFQGSGSSLPEDIKTIGIMPVDNKTTEPDLGLQLTESLRERFDRYGAVKVVDDVSGADAVLSTAIESVSSQVASVTGSSDIELQSDLIITVSGELKASDGRVLWRSPRITVTSAIANVRDAISTTSSAFAQSGIGSSGLKTLDSRELSRGQQEVALQEMIEEVARKIYLDAVAADF